MSQATSRFCPSCGAEHEADAQFCEQCGHQFPASTAPTATQPVVPPSSNGGAPPTARSPWPWVIGGIAIVAVLAGTAIALVLLLGGDDESPTPAAGYPSQAAAVIDPVGSANSTMSARLDDLDPGEAIADVAAARRTAAAAARTAQTELQTLTPGADDNTTAADTAQALRAERTLLAAMAAAIAKPSERTANALAAPSQAARDAWARVRETIPGAGGELAHVDRLAAWARGAGGTAATKQANAGGASCGGFEGVSGVYARNVDCQTALRVAVSAQQAGTGTEGFACRVTQAGTGTDRWACTKGSATITFSATNDTPDDTSGGVQQDDTGDDVQPVEPGDMPGEGGDVPEGTPDDVVPDDTGADQGVG